MKWQSMTPLIDDSSYLQMARFQVLGAVRCSISGQCLFLRLLVARISPPVFRVYGVILGILIVVTGIVILIPNFDKTLHGVIMISNRASLSSLSLNGQ